MSSPNPRVDSPAPAKARTVELLRDLAPELALMGVTKVALFGSVARGDDREDSDIDIAVSTVNPRDFQLRASVRRLVEVHCNRRVDVVPLPLRYPLSEVAGDDLLGCWVMAPSRGPFPIRKSRILASLDKLATSWLSVPR